MQRPTAVLSIDLEWFSHIPAYRNSRGTLTDSESDIGLSAVETLLDLFDAHNSTSTFFVVSDIAERHPELIVRIADAGHEIGSHTHRHVHLSEIRPAERREELTTSREVLERVADTSVTGFRAPSFDIPSDHFTALDAAGYEYDSSIAPCRSIPGWYGGEHDIQRPSPASRFVEDAPSDLPELPVAVMPGLRLPLTGTWLRFFGVRYTILGMKLLARRGITPILYVHPWELADLPAVDGVPRRVYWRTGKWMRDAVDTVLSEQFEFVTTNSLAERVDTN